MKAENCRILSIAIFAVTASCENNTGDSANRSFETNREISVTVANQIDKGFENVQSISTKMNLLTTQVITQSEARSFDANFRIFAQTEGYHDAMELASVMILSADSQQQQIGRLFQFSFLFPDYEDRLSLYSYLPAGKLRSSCAASMRGEALRSNAFEDLHRFYEAIPLGSDRIQVAVSAAVLCKKVNGVGSSLDFIAGLEMSDERYAAATELILSDDFKPDEIRGQHEESFANLMNSLDEDDRKTLIHLLGAER